MANNVRLNVSVPEDLVRRVRSEHPDLNVSAVLQTALRGLLECGHERLACADCGEPVDGSVGARDALRSFWSDLLYAWQPLVDRGGTAEGAARVAKSVAVAAGVPGADLLPLPRPPRQVAHRRAS